MEPFFFFFFLRFISIFFSNERANPKTKQSVWCGLTSVAHWLIERAKCRSPRYIVASLKKCLSICKWWSSLQAWRFVLIKWLTKLLTLDEMLWNLFILINTNDPPPKFGTVDFLCAVLRFFYMSFNSLIIEHQYLQNISNFGYTWHQPEFRYLLKTNHIMSISCVPSVWHRHSNKWLLWSLLQLSLTCLLGAFL